MTIFAEEHPKGTRNLSPLPEVQIEKTKENFRLLYNTKGRRRRFYSFGFSSRSRVQGARDSSMTSISGWYGLKGIQQDFVRLVGGFIWVVH